MKPQIRTVVTKSDMRQFIKLPWSIYKDDPNWVPPLLSDIKASLDPVKNPTLSKIIYTMFLAMKDGALFANAGHFDIEISKNDLKSISVNVRKVRENIEEYQLDDNKKLYLLSEGRLVNLAAGNGHPTEIMDLTFALQALSLQYLLNKRQSLKPGVIPVPNYIDEKVALIKLKTLGISIDTLTQDQEQYLESWEI